MPRHFDDWIERYVEMVAPKGEAPTVYHYWSAVGAVAGALRRRVWIDQAAFRWYANMYIILDGPPATKKSTAINQVMSILQEVPGGQVRIGLLHMARVRSTSGRCQGCLRRSRSRAQEHPRPRAHRHMCLDPWHIRVRVILQPPSPGDGQHPDRTVGQQIQPRLGQSHQDPRRQCLDEPVRQHRRRHHSPWLADNFKGQFGGWGLSSRIIFVYADPPNGTLPIPKNYGEGQVRARDGQIYP
jgi:hypothetical protein